MATGDIRAAQRALNHRQSTTTIRYLDGERTKDKNRQILSEVIRQMTRNAVNTASANTAETSGRQPRHDNTQDKLASASFGHECRAPEREDGQVCTYFQKCLDCPGLVIPKTANQLARLLQAEETFRKARQRLHEQRWDALYAKSYATLTEKILPQFPSAMIATARTLMKTLPRLPDLE